METPHAPGSASLRTTALLLTMAGLALVSFSLPVAGIDLLLDPVGFPLIFNGLRVLGLLRKQAAGKAGALRAASFLALGLVVPSAIQLLAGGTLLLVSAALRLAGEGAVYLLMLAALLPTGLRRAFKLGAAVVLALLGALRLLEAVLIFIGWKSETPGLLVFQLLLMLLLGLAAFAWPAVAEDH